MLRYKKNPPRKSFIQVDGKLYPSKYIGRGSYSRVFRVGDRVVYYTRGDCGKEVLAMFQYDRMMHLPEIIRHENVTTVQGVWYVFSSPFYRDVTAKDKRAWKLMKEIMFVSLRALPVIYSEKYKGIYAMQKFVDVIRPIDALPRSVINALQEVVNVASNCSLSDVGFDLHKKNFGVDEYGTLIFRDPIFVRE
jgi:hypothetical protein